MATYEVPENKLQPVSIRNQFTLVLFDATWQGTTRENKMLHCLSVEGNGVCGGYSAPSVL